MSLPSVDEVGLHTVKEDFTHHQEGVARLNNQALGAIPKQVLDKVSQFRYEYYSNSDSIVYGGSLRDFSDAARKAVIPILRRIKGGATYKHFKEQAEAKRNFKNINEDQLVFVEYTVTAFVTVLLRWAAASKGKKVMILCDDLTYKPMLCAIQQHMTNAKVIKFKILGQEGTKEWMPSSHSEILRRLLPQVVKLGNNIDKDTYMFCLLTQVPCVPSMVCPVKDMLNTYRKYLPQIKESVIDCAGSLGNVPGFDVLDLGDPDWVFMNLHKWTFSPASCCLMYAKSSELMKTTQHPIPGAEYHTGLVDYMEWPNRGDYSVIATIQY